MDKEIKASCTNCKNEYFCPWVPEMVCRFWEPDQEAEKEIKGDDPACDQ